MPRTASVALKGHVYHVLIRGINLQDIFEDVEDFRKYLYPYLEQDEPRADSTPFRRVMATLRNFAISLLRANGYKNITAAIRRMATHQRQAFCLLGLRY